MKRDPKPPLPPLPPADEINEISFLHKYCLCVVIIKNYSLVFENYTGFINMLHLLL